LIDRLIDKPGRGGELGNSALSQFIYNNHK
jgi:hypothetical protein